MGSGCSGELRLATSATSQELRPVPRQATICELHPHIAWIADVRADRGSRQIQRFGDLLFPAPFAPEPDKQLVALGFGRGFSRQEFWGREWSDVPIRQRRLLDAGLLPT
jgi:hypothetical protein